MTIAMFIRDLNDVLSDDENRRGPGPIPSGAGFYRIDCGAFYEKQPEEADRAG